MSAALTKQANPVWARLMHMLRPGSRAGIAMDYGVPLVGGAATWQQLPDDMDPLSKALMSVAAGSLLSPRDWANAARRGVHRSRLTDLGKPGGEGALVGTMKSMLGPLGIKLSLGTAGAATHYGKGLAGNLEAAITSVEGAAKSIDEKMGRSYFVQGPDGGIHTVDKSTWDRLSGMVKQLGKAAPIDVKPKGVLTADEIFQNPDFLKGVIPLAPTPSEGSATRLLSNLESAATKLEGMTSSADKAVRPGNDGALGAIADAGRALASAKTYMVPTIGALGGAATGGLLSNLFSSDLPDREAMARDRRRKAIFTLVGGGVGGVGAALSLPENRAALQDWWGRATEHIQNRTGDLMNKTSSINKQAGWEDAIQKILDWAGTEEGSRTLTWGAGGAGLGGLAGLLSGGGLGRTLGGMGLGAMTGAGLGYYTYPGYGGQASRPDYLQGPPADHAQRMPQGPPADHAQRMPQGPPADHAQRMPQGPPAGAVDPSLMGTEMPKTSPPPAPPKPAQSVPTVFLTPSERLEAKHYVDTMDESDMSQFLPSLREQDPNIATEVSRLLKERRVQTLQNFQRGAAPLPDVPSGSGASSNSGPTGRGFGKVLAVPFGAANWLRNNIAEHVWAPTLMAGWDGAKWTGRKAESIADGAIDIGGKAYRGASGALGTVDRWLDRTIPGG